VSRLFGRAALLSGCAALATLAGLTNAALAQRAVATPSSETATLGNAPPPPSPGVISGPCGAVIVCGGELSTQLQALGTTYGGGKGAVSDDTSVDLYTNYSTWLSAYSNIKLERQRGDNLDSFFPDRKAAFRSEGLTLRQLFLAARPFSAATLYGGKIHPNFGSAFEEAPGNFYNFGTDYEQDERIGVGAQYLLPEKLGHYLRLSIESFFLDTSPLSESLFSRPSINDADPSVRPYRYTLGQFGPSNTHSLSSYTVALRGGEAERGLTYQLSFTQEATADPAGKTEYGQSVGLSYDPTGDGIPLTTRIGVTPFVEFTHFNNFQNNPSMARAYLIAGATFNYVRWQLSLAGGLRHTHDPQNPPDQAFTNALATQERDALDHQENISLNYALPIAISYSVTVGAGINHVHIAGEDSWSFGPSANLSMSF
jgi:hypothetical protein